MGGLGHGVTTKTRQGVLGLPQFIMIANFWVMVNCGLYYANADWLPAMRTSLGAR